MPWISGSETRRLLARAANGRQRIDYVASKGGATDRIYSFIHYVYDSPKGTEIAAPHRPFVTAADLAVQLRDLGLLGDDTLTAVVHEVETKASDSADTVIPCFLSCTQFSEWPALSTSAGADEYQSVKDVVSKLCTGGRR